MSDRLPSYRNLWALTVLCLLRERSMHPYELQRLMGERNKNDFLELKRGSLYHNIERLQRAGLIAAVETNREGRRPERTVYRLTADGERELLTWLRELLAKPDRDSLAFVAALSFLGHLGQDDALEQLSVRMGHLQAEVEGLNGAINELTPRLGRLLLVEAEYVLAMRKAELEWVRVLIDEIATGRFSCNSEAFFPRSDRSVRNKPLRSTIARSIA